MNTAADAGQVAVTLDATSHWTLGADSHVTSFTGDLANVDTNGHHLWVNGKQVK